MGPALAMVFILGSLALINMGLDEMANPRIRSKNRNISMLQVKDLSVSYYTDMGRAHALNHVNLDLKRGEKLGLVGESGSGKSTMGLAMMRMIKPLEELKAVKSSLKIRIFLASAKKKCSIQD